MTISNESLLEAVNDRNAFYKTYIDITNRAISMYTKAGRRKSALKLHGSLAALDLYVFTSVPGAAKAHLFVDIASNMHQPLRLIAHFLPTMLHIHGLALSLTCFHKRWTPI